MNISVFDTVTVTENVNAMEPLLLFIADYVYAIDNRLKTPHGLVISSIPITGGTATSGGELAQAAAQSFVAQGSFLKSIEFPIGSGGTPLDNLVIKITSVLGGSSLGSITTTSGGHTGFSETFTFSSPVSLTPGNTYYIEITRTGAADGSNLPFVGVSFDGGSWSRDFRAFITYPDGIVYRRDDSVWAPWAVPSAATEHAVFTDLGFNYVGYSDFQNLAADPLLIETQEYVYAIDGVFQAAPYDLGYETILVGGSGSGDTYQQHAQSFRALGSKIQSVWIRSRQVVVDGTPSDDFIVTIRSSLDGSQLGNVTIPASATPASDDRNEYVFSSPVSVTTGNLYYIQVSRSSDTPDQNSCVALRISLFGGQFGSAGLYTYGDWYNLSQNVWATQLTPPEHGTFMDFGVTYVGQNDFQRYEVHNYGDIYNGPENITVTENVQIKINTQVNLSDSVSVEDHFEKDTLGVTAADSVLVRDRYLRQFQGYQMPASRPRGDLLFQPSYGGFMTPTDVIETGGGL